MKTALALGAIIACCPAMLAAQTSTKTTPQTHPASVVKGPVAQTSTGDVARSGEAISQAMLAGQKDPNLIGSPAWWSTRATADGKPLSDNKR